MRGCVATMLSGTCPTQASPCVKNHITQTLMSSSFKYCNLFYPEVPYKYMTCCYYCCCCCRYKSGQEIYSEELTQYLSKHFPDEKPPSTAFEKWRVEVENEIKKERPEISEKKLNKKLIRRWEKLEESEKSLLEKKARNKLSSFHAKLLKKVKYPME